MENEGENSKIQVGIDWANMGIQKAVPKLDPHHPSFRPDLSRICRDTQPRVKSSVVSKGPQRQSSSRSTPPRPQESSGQQSKKTSRPTNPEKVELKEKPYDWIVAQLHWLDPKGYVEEIHSL